MPGVRKVVWHKRDFRDTLPVKLALRPYRASMLLADRYHAAVEELAGRRVERGQLRYWLGPDDVEIASRALGGAGLVPGSRSSASRRARTGRPSAGPSTGSRPWPGGR